TGDFCGWVSAFFTGNRRSFHVGSSAPRSRQNDRASGKRASARRSRRTGEKCSQRIRRNYRPAAEKETKSPGDCDRRGRLRKALGITPGVQQFTARDRTDEVKRGCS